MSKDEAATLITQALDDIDAHIAKRKKWIDNWKLEMEVLQQGLRMCRDDVQQMRLEEQQ